MSEENHEIEAMRRARQKQLQLAWRRELQLTFGWTFESQIKWLKTLFTFRNKEQRQTWADEMGEARYTKPARLTEETRLSTPRLLVEQMWDDFMQVDPDTHEPVKNPDAKPFNLHDLFRSEGSVREYFRDMFSGWTPGWETRFAEGKNK